MPLKDEPRRYVEELRSPRHFPLEALTDPEASRAYLEAIRPKVEPGGPEIAAVLDGDADGVPVRVYRPTDESGLPVLVYCHGGGWVRGSVDGDDLFCRTLSLVTGVIVVSVEYRLAPEHPYPTPLDDAEQASLWVRSHVASFGGDPDRIGVMGSSAGANLTTALTLRDREANRTPFTCQILMYPVLDGSRSSASYRTTPRDTGLEPELMEWFWNHYTPDESVRGHPDVSPLAAVTLAGLPPALVFTAEYDILRDEGRTYAERLKADGVPSELHEFAGQIHGFINQIALFSDAAVALDMIAAYCRRVWPDRPSAAII